MAEKNLGQFVEQLKKCGELKIVDIPVNPDLEIAEFTDRECKQPGGGKALMFTNTGTSFAVVTNIYGSKKRIAMALNSSDVEQKSLEIKDLFTALTLPRNSFKEKVMALPLLKKITKYFPKHKKGRGECQQNVCLQPDINMLPILKTWPYDGGKFITLPIVITHDPQTGVRNVGMYRAQVFSSTSVGMHWHKHKTGARHYQEYKKLGKKMPVAIALGGDPVYAYSATAPLPDGIDEFLLAGFLRNNPVKLVKCITQPEIEVPADCDFVIEGYVDTAEDLVLEGPFGDHTGFYSLADFYPQMHITAITYRNNAIYPATVVGIPPMEDAYISVATEEIFKFPIKMAICPELENLHMPTCGVEHNIVVVKINNAYEGLPQKAKNSLWGAGQMMFNKILIAIDKDIQLTDYKSLAQELLPYFVPEKDITIDFGTSDVLDHASRQFACGGKLFLDLTTKLNREPINIKCNNESLEKIKNNFWEISYIETGFLEMLIPVVAIYLKEKSALTIENIVKSVSEDTLNTISIIIFVEETLPKNDFELLFWYCSGNIDPKTDCLIINGILSIDATAKTLKTDGFTRPWPQPVVMDDETIKKIDEKYGMLKLEKFIPSPSLKYKAMQQGVGAVKYNNS